MTVTQREEISACAEILKKVFPDCISCAEIRTMNYSGNSTGTEYIVYLNYPSTGPKHYYGETIFHALANCLNQIYLEENND
jgi:hypothetical protein